MTDPVNWGGGVLVAILIGVISLRNQQFVKDREKLEKEVDDLKEKIIRLETLQVTDDRVREIINEVQQPLREQVGSINSKVEESNTRLNELSTQIAIVLDRLERASG